MSTTSKLWHEDHEQPSSELMGCSANSYAERRYSTGNEPNVRRWTPALPADTCGHLTPQQKCPALARAHWRPGWSCHPSKSLQSGGKLGAALHGWNFIWILVPGLLTSLLPFILPWSEIKLMTLNRVEPRGELSWTENDHMWYTMVLTHHWHFRGLHHRFHRSFVSAKSSTRCGSSPWSFLEALGLATGEKTDAFFHTGIYTGHWWVLMEYSSEYHINSRTWT